MPVKRQDIKIGDVFGNLEVKEVTSYQEHNFIRSMRYVYRCVCKLCNGEKVYKAHELNKFQDCGCSKKGKKKPLKYPRKWTSKLNDQQKEIVEKYYPVAIKFKKDAIKRWRISEELAYDIAVSGLVRAAVCYGIHGEERFTFVTFAKNQMNWIARREFRDMSARIKTFVPLGMDGYYDYNFWIITDDVYERMSRKEELDNLLRFLTAKEKKVLHMRFWQDMELKDIALELGVTRSMISMIINNSLEKMHWIADKDEN